MLEGRIKVRDLEGHRSVVVRPECVFSIGRRVPNDLVVTNSQVSRLHATISAWQGRFVLRDLRSVYGTLVNGAPVEADRQLEDGDRIQLGTDSGVHLVFTLHDVEDANPQALSAPLPTVTDPATLYRDLHAAYETQQDLLPERGRSGPFFEAFGEMLPCRSVGGDFFDYLELPERTFGFVLADVAGKGSPAALLAARAQVCVASQASGQAASAMTDINRTFMLKPMEGRFVTMFYGALSDDGQLTYCNAGHNPPLLLRRDEVVTLGVGGIPVGVFADTTYHQDTVSLQSGDTLVVFSDGVSEAISPDDEEFGDSRLGAVVRPYRESPLEQSVASLMAAVRMFVGRGSQGDDITALMVRYRF